MRPKLSSEHKTAEGAPLLWTHQFSETVRHPPIEKTSEAGLTDLSWGQKVHDCPRGYPHLSAFLASDENLMIYRRFTYIQSRLILNKQDEMRQLEYELDRLDERGNNVSPEVLNLTGSSQCSVSSPKQVLAQLGVKFNEYGMSSNITSVDRTDADEVTLLSKSRELTSFESPGQEDFEELSRFFVSNRPMDPKEAYIRHQEDLLSLNTRERESWLGIKLWNILRKNDNSALLRVRIPIAIERQYHI